MPSWYLFASSRLRPLVFLFVFKVSLKITYPELPVSLRRDEVIEAIRHNQVIVVVGETGSGKTTQLPKMAIEAALQAGVERGRVGCTQPRRLAAASVAKRVSEELKLALGEEVGYQVRFTDKTSPKTALKFMTDGILLAETQNDPNLKQYHTIIIDEAHERSLNIDFLLGYLRELLGKRSDLKLIISSATLDAGGFSEFFGTAPIVEVKGRTFPVDTYYLPPNEDEELAKHVVRATHWISDLDRRGDVLVFLPGEREIRECVELLEGQKFYNTEVLPLFARLGLGDQQRIFQPGSKRRIVLATNVAETSITIPRIVYVIDSGIARVSRYSPGRSVQRLQIEEISQASARQRKGRCGRISEGICVRLYEEDTFEERSEFTDPEIRRSSLAGVILQMKNLSLPEIGKFPLLDPPSPKLVTEGYRTLREIGALDRAHELTKIGHALSRLPVDPRLGRMLLEAQKRRCLAEVSVVVAALSIMDVRERPAEKKEEADRAQQKYKHVDSDFLSLLRIWNDVQPLKEKGRWRKNQLRKLSRERFLNFLRVIEWDNLTNEIRRAVRDALKWSPKDVPAKEKDWAPSDEVHKALLAGVPRQFGLWDREKRAYKSPGGREFAVFPGSGLFNTGKRIDWFLAMELVDTSRLWARKVAKLDPAWVEEVAPQLCRSKYHSAFFDEQQGAVYAKENVICGGLRIIDGRNVHYGRVDQGAAREVFIRDGLLGQKMKSNPKLLKQLNRLRKEVGEMEHALRRVDGLWSEEAVFEYFDTHLPQDVHTAKSFHEWMRGEGGSLQIQMDDVVYEDVRGLGLNDFPEFVEFSDQQLDVYYHAAPGERDDGVTFGIHIDQLGDVADWVGEWGVPGNLAERVRLLIRSLPKNLRTACNPASEAAADFVEEDLSRDDSLLVTLAEFLKKRTGLLIRDDDFDASRLPEELVTKFWIYDDDRNELGFGVSLSLLKEEFTVLRKERFEEQAGKDLECSGLKGFPEEGMLASLDVGGAVAYPALVDEGATLGIRVYADKEESEEAHRGGLIRLMHFLEKKQIAYVRKTPPLDWAVSMQLSTLGVGASIEQLIDAALTMSFKGDVRTLQEVNALTENIRGDLYSNVEKLGRSLASWTPAVQELKVEIEGMRGDRNLHSIAEDLDEELAWLLRGEFVMRTRIETVLDYGRYFEAMKVRLQRVKGFPLIKDLEKMELIRKYWSPWFLEWSKNPEVMHLWEIGWMLEEFRISLFAPNIRTKMKVSEKRISERLEKVGLI